MSKTSVEADVRFLLERVTRLGIRRWRDFDVNSRKRIDHRVIAARKCGKRQRSNSAAAVKESLDHEEAKRERECYACKADSANVLRTATAVSNSRTGTGRESVEKSGLQHSKTAQPRKDGNDRKVASSFGQKAKCPV